MAAGQRRRPEQALGPPAYAPPFLFLATAPAGFLAGGAWAFLTALAMPLALCGLDAAFGSERRVKGRPETPGYRLLPWLYIAAQLAVTAWAAIQVAEPRTPPLAAAGLTVSTGLTAGVFGILAAHEMVHSRSGVERAWGLSLLASVGYMHFRIAHIHGHHRRAATLEDPATARRGESAYAFLVRTVAGQAREAWAFEAERLRRRGRGALSLRNRMVLYLLIEAALAAGAGLLGGWRALAFLAGQAVLAVTLLELFNYIAHYGLMRRAAADGRPERLGPQHSWNAGRRMNNAALFNMGRHSDHHRHPARPYQRLDADPQAPQLPAGYAAAILMALVPPLWRRVMDPRAARAAVDGTLAAGSP
jgi:alkane 1-monooxygenase